MTTGATSLDEKALEAARAAKNAMYPLEGTEAAIRAYLAALTGQAGAPVMWRRRGKYKWFYREIPPLKNDAGWLPLFAAAPVQAPVAPVDGLVTEALNESLKLAKLAATLTGCRGDDDYVWGVQAKIEAALAAISQGDQP